MSGAAPEQRRVRIPAEVVDLLEGRALAHLATIRKDGTPHVTPVWVDHDRDHLLVNVRVDRLKAANLRERRAVAVSVNDLANPYRYLTVSGIVVSWTEDGWREHMDRLTQRYMGIPRYPWSFPGERRAIFRIAPQRVYFEMGDVEIPEA